MLNLKQAMKPYSFRGRLQMLLALSAALACMISIATGYAYSHYTLRLSLADNEYAAAIGILELEQKTDLPVGDILQMVVSDDLVTQVVAAPLELSERELNQLSARTILTILGDYSTYPVTYVQMQNSVVRISAARKATGAFFGIFWRTGMISLTFAVFFMLLSMLTAWRIAKPVSQLTQATQRVSEGDFSVHLPETQTDELGDLFHSFNTMTDALERTSWVQRDFIASVSHEFRTPIASIKGYARLLQMPGLDDDKRKEYVDMIAQESDRLSRLSETLLRLSALEQQTAPASLSTYQLDEQVRQVILRLEPVWSAREIEFELNLAPVTIETDSELLMQVWTNLIHNAVKFSEQGGLIEITVRRTDMAEFEVVDHGIGMDAEAQRRIFDRFYQADSSRSHEGVGLGLCLVQRILDILGGEIKVRSKPGEGTSMRVRIPFSPLKKHSGKEDEHAV